MRLLITGGLGFIGSNIINHFVQKKKMDPKDILILDKMTYAADIKNLNYKEPQVIVGDVAALSEDVISVVKSFAPTHIIHMAAESHVDRSIEGDEVFITTNIIGTKNIVKLAHDLKCELIHFSTDEVYGCLPIDSDAQFNESDSLLPNNPYAASKAAADLYIQAYYNTHKAPEYVIVRPSNNYGPNQHDEKFIPTVIRAIMREEPIPLYGNGMNVREWLYTKDTAEYIWNIIEHAYRERVYNIGDSLNRRNNIEMIRMIVDIMRESDDQSVACRASQARIKLVQDRKGHDLKYALDSDYFWSHMEIMDKWFQMHSLEAGLCDTIKHYVERYK